MIRFSLQDDHIGLHCGEQIERQREKMGVRRQGRVRGKETGQHEMATWPPGGRGWT